MNNSGWDQNNVFIHQPRWLEERLIDDHAEQELKYNQNNNPATILPFYYPNYTSTII